MAARDGKGRQCVSARFAELTFRSSFAVKEICPTSKKKKCNNALALAVSYGRLAAFGAPLV
jgi:hypothetical protein